MPVGSRPMRELGGVQHLYSYLLMAQATGFSVRGFGCRVAMAAGKSIPNRRTLAIRAEQDVSKDESSERLH